MTNICVSVPHRFDHRLSLWTLRTTDVARFKGRWLLIGRLLAHWFSVFRILFLVNWITKNAINKITKTSNLLWFRYKLYLEHFYNYEIQPADWLTDECAWSIHYSKSNEYFDTIGLRVQLSRNIGHKVCGTSYNYTKPRKRIDDRSRGISIFECGIYFFLPFCYQKVCLRSSNDFCD